ncbi:phytanoyl-CoA dioxygenase family protein [Legionella gresilensis]|uniref:phytanoyl-CoA dioxygenase family protein n=1 Tax=Legionella gresilensis TaxID=91823 RepID=UPI0010416E8D|nr:phytanoyl-CoA dioxygenase family protein [Legionella gresilensis]
MKISKSKIKQFNEEGYIVIDNVLPMSLLKNMEVTISTVIKDILFRASKELNQPQLMQINNIIDKGIVELRKYNISYPSIIQRIVNRTPAFLNLASHPKLASTVRQLNQYSDDNPLYMLSNCLIFSDPNNHKDRSPSQFTLDWHNDVFSTIPFSQFTHMWIPIVRDATLERGTLMLCPRSHKELIKQEIKLDVPYNHRFKVDFKQLEKFNPTSIEVKLGQGLFFDGNMIHRSGFNSSNHMRYTMIGLFHNIFKEEFLPVATSYKYMKRTPYEHYFQLFGGDHLKPFLYEELESDLKNASV